MIQKPHGIWPGEPQPPHVSNVEQPRRTSHGLMLLDDRGVLHRHVPATKLNHPSAVSHVPLMKRSLQKVRHWDSFKVFCGIIARVSEIGH